MKVRVSQADGWGFRSMQPGVLWVAIQPLIWVWGIATGITVLGRSARASSPHMRETDQPAH